MKILRILPVIIFCAAVGNLLDAQTLRQTGSIRGIITDPDGGPLPGVRITVTGPSLIGSVNDMTSVTGAYRAPTLPTGTYTLVAELAGFKKFIRENIVVETGSNVTIDIQMSPAALAEEVTVVAPSPTVDITSSKVNTVVSDKTLRSIPFNRNLDYLMKMAPGVTGDPSAYREGSGGGTGTSFHGNIDTQNSYEVDGVNASDSGWQIRVVHVNYEAMEEVELVMGGLPAQVGNTGGDFINVVTKSGGNEFHGQVLGYYTNHNFTEVLYSQEQIAAMGAGQPNIPLNQREAEAFLGGPIIKDKLWFFSDVEYQYYRNTVPYIPTTILGKFYPNIYVDVEDWIRAMAKFTAQLSPSLRFFLMGQWENYNRPVWTSSARNTVPQGKKDNWKIVTTGNLSWILSSNTILDLRAGYINYNYLILNYPGTDNSIAFTDGYTGYSWGASSYNNFMYKPQGQASARLTHFKDDFLGGNHEFGAGAEFNWGRYRWDSWVGVPMRWSYYNENPYYYRGLYGLTGPHPTFGDGQLRFLFEGKNRDTCIQDANSQKFGAYIQDSWNIKNRLTVNLGFRFDYQTGNLPATTKTPANSDLAIAIGEAYIVPLFGLNPFATYQYPGWDNPITYKTLSPRVGLTYDLFGNGKTALRASFSQYAEPLLITDFSDSHPLQPRLDYLDFYWWDLNNNGQPDAPPLDRYQNFGVSPKFMTTAYFKNKTDPNIRDARVNEFTASIQHELFPNLRITLQYFNRNKIDKYAHVLYEPDSKRFWYSYQKAPDWWIPFTTTVPAAGGFPAQTVNMYFMSATAPYQDMFNTVTNVPEVKIRYQSMELIFEKRMSQGWSFGGSFVYARQKSTGGLSGANAGTNITSANQFVNADGLDPSDRPLQVKFYGVFSLPWNLMASFFGQYISGLPWARTVTVYPPAAWQAANNAMAYSYAVNLETVGTRRYPSLTSVDFRLEKEFFGKLRLTLDVYNVLGDRQAIPTANPGGNWRPVDNNSSSGTFTPDAYFGKVTSISGVRYFKFGAAFRF